ncbi:MAG: NACHT domain-containing protein [Verrucomicrobia bacterium]|nr:NACHT domain-containing protein [Verrucomicrobiota bacterium]
MSNGIFENEVATLYRLLGFEVKQNTKLCGIQIDLMIEKREGGLHCQAIVECKDNQVTAADRDQILAQQNLAQHRLPKFRWIAVSSIGFAADTRVALEGAGIDCATYSDLLRELVPLDNYAKLLISQIENEINDQERGWGGRDLFIPPDLETDITWEKYPAVAHFDRWLSNERSNLLVVLGDLGTGKTTLLGFLAYQLARNFRDDPVRHPAPVLIPLRQVRREVSLDSIVIEHFRDSGLPGLNFPHFESLLRKGRIVLCFDAFDEMADRVRWEITQGIFQELCRAAKGAGKVILTCRTHYFKDHTEQARLIGEDPSLTAAETALYRELHRQSNAEVVYLQEFNDAQIREYLQRARGSHADADWQNIQTIYKLRDLAQRPLLLDMIVRSLPGLKRSEQVNAASLYTVYTNLWVEHDFKKGRVVLNRDTKLALMIELAWQMWTKEKDSFSTAQLVAFVARYHAAKTLEFGDQEVEDISHEVQTASFLKRSPTGNDWHFMHGSFREFFVARRLANEVRNNKAGKGFNRKRIAPEIYLFIAQIVCQSLDDIAILCRWAFEETGKVAWNAQYVLAFLKHYRAKETAANLVTLCRSGKLRSGVTWVLGELGIATQEVLELLEEAVRRPDPPDAWWESAFALEKLNNATGYALEVLVRTLPKEWTWEEGLKHLEGVSQATDRTHAELDQQAVVAVVKGHREGHCEVIEERLIDAFDRLDFSRDTVGRRSYYGIWLFGELRLASQLQKVIDAASHDLPSVTNMAAEALGKIGGVQGPDTTSFLGKAELSVLGELLSSNYYRTRIHAAEAIRKVRGVSLVPALRKALETEPLLDVRVEIAKTIDSLQAQWTV